MLMVSKKVIGYFCFLHIFLYLKERTNCLEHIWSLNPNLSILAGISFLGDPVLSSLSHSNQVQNQENSSLSSKARDPTHASAFHNQKHPPIPNLGDICSFQLLILPWEVIEKTTIFQTKKQLLLPQNLTCFHSLNANRLFTSW